MRRTVSGNARTIPVLAVVPDRWGVQAASLGVMTHTASPASRGVNGVFAGLAGYGVHRFAGRTRHAVQLVTTPVGPVSVPLSRRLGFGAGVTGQPGLPSTGDVASGLTSLSWLGMGQFGRAGLGN